jgi:translocating chain-associated membrane protein 1
MPPPPALKKKSGTKNPPIFSQEYLIQNHGKTFENKFLFNSQSLGDIACGILMIIALGTVVQATSPYCTAFFGPRHNVTNFDSFNSSPPPFFNYGYKDLAMLFSYTLICITAHAIWQEYVLDKLYKKLHLSKSKNAKFFESGQLILFYVTSVLWALMIFNEEGYFRSGLEYLWRDYPYTGMTTWTKLYFIVQVSYWLHNYPELYLQKIRKEDIPARIVYTSLYLITILYAYVTRFWRISIVLLTIHYLIEIFYHASRLAHFYATIKTGSASAKTISTYLFKIWNVVFVIGRLASVVLAWLTFWFGLKTSSINKITFTSAPINENNTTGNESVIISNFNTPTVRLFTLVATGVLQFWLVWNFIQVKRESLLFNWIINLVCSIF